ncbi:OB-fold nucleic acid binding domain-containing protein isoform 6 [Theobroma cacao]|uniref:OB-fold nucleic acid binding domain-containing protein isoform 6 n=1 Tax=Theobroma cacao TaxID=3641 RepID=A0A061FRZ8_THECC|nr:OB-fold nucleic acid binding domain-containing protein isoform 6 [Theobroma cacao]
MATSGNNDPKRRQLIVSSICKHFSLDPKAFSSEVPGNDIKNLYLNILKSSGKESPKNNDEVMKWIAFAESFPKDSKACHGVLNELNADLAQKSVLLGNGFTPSEADVIVFSAVHNSVIGLSNSEKDKLPHVMRWMDYIQSKEDLGALFQKILLEKPGFEPQKKAKGDKEAVQEKKKAPETEASDKDKELSVSLLNIQVGLICKAWKHPSADSLLVEEIDVGEAKLRQVVSGLAKYCSPEQLTNRRVVLITNVKPGKLRDVMSEGLVLCASNEDHTAVEPLLPPEGAKPGEHVSFSGIDGKPDDVLNPKKKQLEKITPVCFPCFGLRILFTSSFGFSVILFHGL